MSEQAIQAANAALDTKPKPKSVFDLIEENKEKLNDALPSHLDINRLVRVMTNVIRYNPSIAQCTQRSLLSAVVQSVQLGLEPNILGHCWFVPYANRKTGNSEIQFQIGYKGWMELVQRSGKAVILMTETVREKDVFEIELGIDQKLKHIPANGDRGKIIGFYATAKHLISNEKVFKYMTVDEIDKVKALAKMDLKNPDAIWNKFYEQMAIKTVLKNLCKLLPKSVELDHAIAADETTKHNFSNPIEASDVTDWSVEEMKDKTEPVQVNTDKLEKALEEKGVENAK